MPKLLKSICLVSLFLFFCSTFVFAEDIAITTYYPSPYGSYKNLNIYNQDESGTLTDFTQAVTKAGLLITTDLTNTAYTPGIFWSTQDNNPTKPKAGIYLYEDTTNGTSMYFGTSNAFATGITNATALIDPAGHIIGTPVAGRWTDDVSSSATGYYTWSTETLNTDSTYITRADSNSAIQFLKPGYYLVNVSVLQYCASGVRCDVNLYKNGAIYINSLGNGGANGYLKHSFSEIISVVANEKIQVNSVSPGTRYAGGAWTSLSVTRLN